ncbi:HAD-IA family hydrolase [Desulfuromonas carbonis]|uniref:HAD family hydrolase n=1 Tax=Desulfuromonas sp. DDH964 TaxID=1823759 RepID=UPI00078B48BE|nr:HAD family hydrolase [Desulfuromonas sp. DDH964]AMV72497.1 HAD superfamily hydrolase [Desulfuromonas sp. DDH964]
MKPVRGIIYDCDGVLFESRAANLAYYNSVLKSFDAAPVSAADRELARICHTAASPEVFSALLGADRVTSAMVVAQGLDYRQFIPHMSPEPGLVEALATLSTFLPLAVATNRGNSMSEILSHFSLGQFFQVVITSRDVPRPKPAPDMLHLAARRLGLATEELLFVGDSELDRQAAAAAGIRFVGYKPDGENEGEGVRINAHRELVELLQSEGVLPGA